MGYNWVPSLQEDTLIAYVIVRSGQDSMLFNHYLISFLLSVLPRASLVWEIVAGVLE